MKLSDISNQQLSPGRYLITASYDGNDEYNPAQAQLVLVIDETGEVHYETEPIEDEGTEPKIKQSPNVSFALSTLSINERDVQYPFDWHPYFNNPFNVGYNVYVSEGLLLDQNEYLYWEYSDTYTLVVTTQETDVYESQTIQLTLDVTSKINPQIEYTNANNLFILEDGSFVKRYYNIEKREGVYMFDLLQPTNPYALPLKYKIDDTKHGTIDEDSNKVYISTEGKYKITAYYEGDDVYRSSITYYILKYYEGEEPTGDEPVQQPKIDPNLSFMSSNVTEEKTEDNRYSVLPLINPYSVSGGNWVVSKGTITYDGKIITYDDTGAIIVSYIYNGNDKYNPQTVSYILNIKEKDNPEGLPLADIGFKNLIVTVEENELHEYQIQPAYNNSGVAIDYYYNDELIENGVLRTPNIGNLTIVGISENNGTFASTKIYYTLKIVKYQQQDPEISFDDDSMTIYQTNNNEYLLQFVSNPHNVELVWTTNKGTIEDNILYFDDLGTVVITVTSKPNFYYYESTISYTLVIKETPKLSPELSFDEETQFFNYTDSQQYQIQPVNNPHNVELRWFSDRGELNSELNPTYLTITSYSGPINIYCKSVEDDTYKSEMVSYKLFVGAAKKYIQYTKHADYEFALNQGTFDLEILRYPKSQDLEYDPTEWTFTSSLPSYCMINDKYYTETEDDIVVMVKVTVTKPCDALISTTFSGNDDFYNSSNIRVHINLTGKLLLSPEISFSNGYEITELKNDYKYVLQDVQNPHNVGIVYSSSSGTVEGNVLTYQDRFNVIITATSIEDDTYASQTISYKLEFKESQKPSSGIHFPLSTVTVTQNNDGIYELQGIVDAEDNPISYSNLPGYYDASAIGDISYDDDKGCYIIDKSNWNGNITIKFIIYETATYKKETITYTLTILSNEKQSPNLAFANYQINVVQNSNGIYPLQALINPNNVPVTWFCSKGEFDDDSNPQNIIFAGREYIRIGVRSEETQDFKSQEQAYGMSIMLPSKKDAGLYFDKYSVYMQRNREGIYPLQTVNNPNNVSPLTYSINKGRIEGQNIIYDGIGQLTITVSYAGDDIYNAVNLRYTLDISGQLKGYLGVEDCQDVEMTGELNEDIEVKLVRWSATKDYVFNPADWSVTSSHFRCTYKTIKTEEINGYIYLIGTFSFKSEGTAYITTSFKGNDDFNSDSGHSVLIEYTVPIVVDNRIIPSISFNNYMVYMTQNNNYMYLLQSLNKPDDVEIDYWEINYGGDDVETAKIIDDEYVYYEGTDYVNVKVYTKETNVYKPTSDSYTLYVNEKTKTGTSISFIWDRITVNRTNDGIYNIQTVTTSPANLPLTWTTSKGQLINDNTQLRYSLDGEVTITASYAGDNDYEPSTASYKLVISGTMQKRYLQASVYKDQTLEVDFGTEYDIPIIKWLLTEDLEYDPSEWYLSNTYATKCVISRLFTEDEGDYRILKAKCTFTTSGYTYLKITFKGNDYFYNSNFSGFEVYFNRAPDVEVRDPEISFPNPTPDSFPYSDEHKYLIQTPTSPYPEVTFNAPTSTQRVIEENGQYYVQTSDSGDVTVTVSSVATGILYEGTTKYMYASKTISYKFTIDRPIIVKDDARLAFENAEENLEYQWQSTGRKLYKVQPLYNPYGVPVTFRANIGGLQKLGDTEYLRDNDQTFTGYIDYGYYVEYEDLADITITVRMQENDYYYSNNDPSYVMHIVRSGQIVNMWFRAGTVEQSTHSNQLYPIQEVSLRPDIPQIRDNVRYTLMSQNGRIVENGSQLCVLYTGTGTVRIKATFDGDATYAPAEAIYTLIIEQSTKPEAPIDFPDADIYTPKNQYDAYPVQQPQSTDGHNYDLRGHLTWTYPEGWYLNTEWANQMISPTSPIEDDTDVLIQCYLEETQFKEKYIQYTLHILTEHKTYLNANVHQNYNLEVEKNTNLKLELIKWPISQGYIYNASEWTFTRWNIGYNDNRIERNIASYITHEQIDGYNVLYYNCITNIDESNYIGYGVKYGVDITFSGNNSYQNGDWGLYVQLTELKEPLPPVDPQEPNIRFNRDIFNYTLLGDDVNTAELPTPTIAYNPEYDYPIEYTYTYWTATPTVDNPQSFEDFIKVGQGIETNTPIIEDVQEGYYIVECTTIASDYYTSKTISTVLNVTRNYNRVDPNIELYNSNVKIENIEEVSTFKIPDVINTSNVEYKWYINNNEITVDENGYFEYHPYSDFVLELRTTQTNDYNSISLYCNYINLGGIDYFGFQSVEDNNEIYWCSNKKYDYTPSTMTNPCATCIYWSKDKVNWTGVRSSKDQTYITTLNRGEKLYFKGAVTSWTYSGDPVVHYDYPLKYSDGMPSLWWSDKGSNYYGFWNYFASTKQFDVFGNIMTLLYGDHLNGQILYGSDQAEYSYKIQKYVFPDGYTSNDFNRNNYAFAGLFCCPDKRKYKYAHVRNANRLVLPEVNAPVGCYEKMFCNCTSLVTAPELHATTLADSCYSDMFNGCTSLVTAPELPATTLAYGCYGSMFNGCTSLVTAPELPATTLANNCYEKMFYGCTSLVTAPELPATTLATECYKNMFDGCTSLVTAPVLPATTLANWCYWAMFDGCTSLVTAPVLPATTLTEGCYSSMFYGCSKLNSITCLATNISALGCTSDWVNGVAVSGTFTKATRMNSWSTGVNGIPLGWNVVI